MNLGLPEIFVILLVALIVFGPQKLPEVARQVGAAMRTLRQLQENVRAELDTVLHPDLNPEPKPQQEPSTSNALDVDHAALPNPEAAQAGADTDTTDDGFAGPSGSFS